MRRSAGIAFVRPSDGTTLLARRAGWLPAHPGTWAHVGGGVEPGESPFEAACREAEEELGLPKGYVQQHGELLGVAQCNSRFILYAVAVSAKALRKIRLNSENTDAAWVPMVHPSQVAREIGDGERLHPSTKQSWATLARLLFHGRADAPTDHYAAETRRRHRA